MNYFFGIKNKLFDTKLTIPKFQNKKKIFDKITLYQATVNGKFWKIEKFLSCFEDNNFFLINQENLDNRNFFFIADKNFKIDFGNKYPELLDFNSYTDTNPAFRSNIQISNLSGGFSSYQSEYPFSMISKKGSVLSSLNLLTNKFADQNILILRNIFYKPIHESFYVYFINYKLKEIVHKQEVFTNQTNFVELTSDMLNDDIYLFSNDYLCIPLYISINKNSISLEHTHPPHEYIISKDKVNKIKNLKFKFNEIINQKNL